MLAIKKEFIVTTDNKKKAVLIDIDTFNKMEEIIENYGLAKYMSDVKNEKELVFTGREEILFHPKKGQTVICQFKKSFLKIFELEWRRRRYA